MDQASHSCRRCGKSYVVGPTDHDEDSEEFCFECRRERREHGRVETVRQDCMNCFGTGSIMGTDCPACDGTGVVEESIVQLPEMGPDGRWML